MDPMEKHPPPILLPAKTDDIPTLARICLTATRNEVLFASPLFWVTETIYYDYVVNFISTKISVPSWQFIKALDPTTKQIIGWGGSNINEAGWADKPNNFDTSILDAFLQDKELSVKKEWLAGRRHVYLAALFTEPEFQGRGVGTSVIEMTHERADNEGLVCYLQGTAVAQPFYMARGWRYAERFEFDLEPWVKGRAWGMGFIK